MSSQLFSPTSRLVSILAMPLEEAANQGDFGGVAECKKPEEEVLLGLNSPYNFEIWNGTSLGNMSRIAFSHPSSKVREKATSVIEKYKTWYYEVVAKYINSPENQTVYQNNQNQFEKLVKDVSKSVIDVYNNSPSTDKDELITNLYQTLSKSFPDLVNDSEEEYRKKLNENGMFDGLMELLPHISQALSTDND